MKEVSTTKMSSKGQVVIPEEIREKLNLAPGAKFIVVGEKDTVVLKIIQPPRSEDIKELLSKARKAAKKAKGKRDDVVKAIRNSRSKK